MLRFKRLTVLICFLLISGAAAFPAIAQEGDQADMFYFIGQHHVTDWQVWIGVFNEVQTFRDTFGNVADTNEVFRASPHRNYITVFEPYPTVEGAMGWATSPDLWAAMLRGTADSPPRVYLNVLAESQNPASGNALILIEQFVSDFDTWHAAFDEMETARAESGATGYRIFRDANYSNHVTAALEFDSLASAESFQDSEAYAAFLHQDSYTAPPIVLLLEPFRE